MATEDALKVGVTRDLKIIAACLSLLNKRIVAVDYKTWFELPCKGLNKAKARFQRAGHILGSAYVEIDVTNNDNNKHRVVFSGDLGAPYTPLLPSPKAPYKADTLVIESTYGDRNHQGRKERTKTLRNAKKR